MVGNMAFTNGSMPPPGVGKEFMTIFADYTRAPNDTSIVITSEDITLIGPDGQTYPPFAAGDTDDTILQCRNCTYVNTDQKTISILIMFELDTDLINEEFQLQLLNLPLAPIRVKNP